MTNRIGRILRGAWRGLLLISSVVGLVWTGALVVGCSGLKTALTTVSQDPTLAYAAPGDWDQPAEGGNGAPYFAASLALLAYTYPAQAPALDIVVRCGWDALPENQRPALQAWLKDQQIVFDLASRGADQPWCRYSREWWIDQGRKTEKEPWRIPVPELKGVEQLCDALVALAHGRRAAGDAAGARDAIRVAFKVADSLKDDPFIQSQSRRVSRMSRILDHVGDLVSPKPDAAEMEAWLKILPAADAFDGVLERAGRWMLKERIDLFRGGSDRYWFWQRLSYRWGPMDFWKLARRKMADPVFEADAIRCLESTRQVIEIWKKPYLEARPEAERLEKAWTGLNESTHPTAPLLWHIGPLRQLEAVQVARARLALVRLGLEWESVKAKTGAYPESSPIADPLTGQPFKRLASPDRLVGTEVPGFSFRTLENGRVFTESSSEPNAWILRN